MICKLHPKFQGKRRPTTKKTAVDGCSCHEWYLKRMVTQLVKRVERLESSAISIKDVANHLYFEQARLD